MDEDHDGDHMHYWVAMINLFGVEDGIEVCEFDLHYINIEGRTDTAYFTVLPISTTVH